MGPERFMHGILGVALGATLTLHLDKDYLGGTKVKGILKEICLVLHAGLLRCFEGSCCGVLLMNR